MLVGWGLGKPMDLNFEIFMVVLLVLSILVVGSFLRDLSSNYLEGALLVVCVPLIRLFLLGLTCLSLYMSLLRLRPGTIPT